MSTSNYTAAGQAIQRINDSSPAQLIKRHQAFINQRIDALAKWVRDGVRPDALLRFCLLEMQTNPKLAACTQVSIYLGLLACAQTGLEPGSLRGEAYLVPFAGKAQFIAGYRGLIKQARRSREVVKVTANVVRSADDFEVDLGTSDTVRHRPARGDRGDIICAYAVAKHSSGDFSVEHMDITELEHIKKVAMARGKSPAWAEWESEMFRKSVIRRLCKRLPMGSGYMVASALEAASEASEREFADTIDILTEGEATRAAEAVSKGVAATLDVEAAGRDGTWEPPPPPEEEK